jgi:hypothetical protein
MQPLSAAPDFGERLRVVVLLRLYEAVQVIWIINVAGQVVA